MSIECGECEHDLRGGHDEKCSRHPANIKKGIQLIVKEQKGDHTLQGYIFTDAKHARTWMSQRFVTDDAYGIRAVEYRERPCGTRYAFKTVKEWPTIKDMLASKLERYY